MLRVTQDVVEVRRWAESRGARPCRDEANGRIWLAHAGDPCSRRDVGWDEFEATFKIGRAVFVYDDAPAGRRFFLGDEASARAFVGEAERAHGGLSLA